VLLIILATKNKEFYFAQEKYNRMQVTNREDVQEARKTEVTGKK